MKVLGFVLFAPVCLLLLAAAMLYALVFTMGAKLLRDTP